MVALLEACDVTNNGLHLGCHLGFYQELEIRLKPWEIVIFVMAWFYFWKKLKKHVFSPKIGLTNCTFDVISRNHSNWPSLNLSQNLRKGWTNSYRKRQVLMFYPLRKLLIRTPAKNVFWRPLNCKTEFAKNLAHAQLTTLASLPPQTVLSVSKFRLHYKALELLVCWRVISVLSSLKHTWLHRL